MTPHRVPSTHASTKHIAPTGERIFREKIISQTPTGGAHA